jgi:APA family basic amino acid/polyamine antiporter
VKLKRELSLSGAVIYGISMILGTGIYTLIGVGAGLAGNSLWLSFVLSALIAIFTALSYAELSSMMPYEAAAYHYTRKAFGNELLSFLVDWMFAFSAMMFAATEAFGFSGYLSIFMAIDPKLLALALIFVMGALNLIGLKLLSAYNKITVLLSVAVLAAFAVLALSATGVPGLDFFQIPESGFLGILSAASVIFFAYTGFESVADISEEVKKSRSVVPKAIILSILICSIIYVSVAVGALNVAGADALSQSTAPLALAASKISGVFALLLSIAAILLTSNTAMTVISTGSRVLYGMSHAGTLNPAFSKLGRRATPSLAIAFVCAISAIAIFATNIKTTAQLTNIGFFVAYLAVNVSLIVLRNQTPKAGFRGPRLAGYPLLAVIGALSSLFMLAYLLLDLWLAELAILVLGLVLYAHGRKPDKKRI